MAGEPKLLRCAVYTRKSTEHGLELEFNSLDAQREACEAYVKSQASQGWRALPQRYDDPAYSGGNLERPALKKLLADIEAGWIDVVVVYKIDRLTRALADFAKLVEAFDARSISFVAVTQQFNTTTSMGRLTLNVLLSFAQFERELSSERVRDKIAASRRKGKWTGGTVPLGYEAREKKLVVNKVEAETVRIIFQRYLELQSFSKLVADLDRRGIVTKRRATKVAKYNGGILFTYGPLAYFLRNRVYLGEVHHGGKWFRGEHKAVIDWQIFDRVQQILASKAAGRTAKRSESGALLAGKLFDDKGNRMSPSFSSKNGVRYRFYVSSALLRGRKAAAGSVSRIAASEIESAVLAALQPHQGRDGSAANPVEMLAVPAPSTITAILIRNREMKISAKQSARIWILGLLHKDIIAEELPRSIISHPDLKMLLERLKSGRLGDRRRSITVLADRRGLQIGSICNALNLSRQSYRRYVRLFDEGGAAALFAVRISPLRKFDSEKVKKALFRLLHQPAILASIARLGEWRTCHSK
jgi:site-specific DNA recombinase